MQAFKSSKILVDQRVSVRIKAYKGAQNPTKSRVCLYSKMYPKLIFLGIRFLGYTVRLPAELQAKNAEHREKEYFLSDGGGLFRGEGEARGWL
jgi:hypothetical protein